MDPPPSDLPESIRQARAGDPAALTRLLEHHGPAVHGRIASEINPKWRSVLEADDVMQITYLEAFLEIGRFESDDPPAFHAWLMRIARNNLRDAIEGLQRKKRPQPDQRVQPAGSDASIAGFLEGFGTSATPSRAAGRSELRAVLEAALARLPEDYAEVLRLYDLEGLSGPETARRMQRSEGSVHMLRARAHDRLRTVLGTQSKFFSNPS